jgi:hypothetical protein
MFSAHLSIALLVYRFQTSWNVHPAAAWASVVYADYLHRFRVTLIAATASYTCLPLRMARASDPSAGSSQARSSRSPRAHGASHSQPRRTGRTTVRAMLCTRHSHYSHSCSPHWPAHARAHGRVPAGDIRAVRKRVLRRVSLGDARRARDGWRAARGHGCRLRRWRWRWRPRCRDAARGARCGRYDASAHVADA